MQTTNKKQWFRKKVARWSKRGLDTFEALLDPAELRKNDMMTILFVDQDGSPYAAEMPGGWDGAVEFLRRLGFEEVEGERD